MTIYMHISVTLLTHLELQKAESVCKTIAAINALEQIVDLKFRTEKRVLLTFIVDHIIELRKRSRPRLWELDEKMGRGERAPFKLGMGPRGLNPTLSL